MNRGPEGDLEAIGCGSRPTALRRRLPGRILLSLASVLLVAQGCSRGDPVRSGAEHFVDAYYVEVNLPRARDEAVGLARSKIEDQIKLLAGQGPPDSGARPTIHYKLLQSQDEAQHDRRGFLFELSIHLDGGETLARRSLVTMREEGGAWRVANFQEID
ncbi:MAG: hypothetical protein WCH13_18105 [Deltaproteobacteria bacterium]